MFELFPKTRASNLKSAAVTISELLVQL